MNTYIVTLHYAKVEGGTQVFTLLVEIDDMAYPTEDAIQKCVSYLNMSAEPIKAWVRKPFERGSVEVVAVK